MHATADHQQELRARLAKAAEKGRTRAQLLGKGEAKTAREAALSELIARGEVIDVGTGKSPKFLLPEHDRRLENACAAVEAKALPGEPRAFTVAQLFVKTKTAANMRARTLEALLREGRLVRIMSGAKWSKALFVHAAALHSPRGAAAESQTSAGASTPPAPAAIEPLRAEENEGKLRAAYDALARETGFADVLISDLQARSGVPLEALGPWLLEASRRGAVLPGRGDWSLASAVARAAAISIGGEPHLRVRFA